MGAEGYQRCVAGELGDSGISVANVLVFAAPSLHGGYVGTAGGSSKWAYDLRIGVCPGAVVTITGYNLRCRRMLCTRTVDQCGFADFTRIRNNLY